MTNCTIQVTADWKVTRTSLPPLSCAGRSSGTLSSFSIRVDAGPKINPDRSLTIEIYDIISKVESVDLTFDQSSCPLFTSLLRTMIQNEIKFILNNKLGDIIEPIANNVLSQFDTPTSIVIPGVSRLWIPLASKPQFTSAAMYSTLQVEFSPLKSSARYSGNKVALSDAPRSTGKMIQVLTNDLVFNSLAWALFSDGLLTFKTQDSIVGFSVSLSVRATAAPVVAIVASTDVNRFHLNAIVPIEITASRSNLGVTVSCQVTAPVAIGIQDQKFVGSIDGNVLISNVKFSVTNTSIGISLSYIESWINGVVNKYLVPRAEALMEAGVPFPPLTRLGFSLSGSQMTSSAKTIFTSTDLVPVARNKKLTKVRLSAHRRLENLFGIRIYDN